jgi:hypothetical protein
MASVKNDVWPVAAYRMWLAPGTLVTDTALTQQSLDEMIQQGRVRPAGYINILLIERWTSVRRPYGGTSDMDIRFRRISDHKGRSYGHTRHHLRSWM